MSPALRGGDVYMRKEKRPWLLAKLIQRNLGKKGYPCSEWHGFLLAGQRVDYL